MIITRTPFRVSLLGGGTDYPAWFRQYGGIVVGGAINKYSYIMARYLPPFHEHKTRVVYSDIETVKNNCDIQHRAIKTTMEHMGLEDGYELFHAADMPGRSGIGSSSAFVVGLVHALSALTGRRRLPHDLREDATIIEQVLMKDCVGCQDQAFAAHGGFNIIRFKKNGELSILPYYGLDISQLEEHLLLLFTGINRNASEVAQSYVPTLIEKSKEQHVMMRLAELGIDAIYKQDYEQLGKLIDQSWRIKSSFSPTISNPRINEAYITAQVYGAWGGKLIGAGGGGCLLLVAPREKHHDIIKALCPPCIHVPFRFEYNGSCVIFADSV